MKRYLPAVVAALGVAVVGGWWLMVAMTGAMVVRILGFLVAGQ